MIILYKMYKLNKQKYTKINQESHQHLYPLEFVLHHLKKIIKIKNFLKIVMIKILKLMKKNANR